MNKVGIIKTGVHNISMEDFIMIWHCHVSLLGDIKAIIRAF